MQRGIAPMRTRLLLLTASVAAVLYSLAHASAALLGDWSFVNDSYGYARACVHAHARASAPPGWLHCCEALGVPTAALVIIVGAPLTHSYAHVRFERDCVALGLVFRALILPCPLR